MANVWVVKSFDADSLVFLTLRMNSTVVMYCE